MRRHVHDYLRLFSRIGDAGYRAAALMVGVALTMALLPAGTALATSAVVRAIDDHSRQRSAMTYVTVPLLVLAAALVVGQVVMAALRPVQAVVQGRINNAHRERVSQLAVEVPTLEQLERPDVQNLITASSGEASSWVERTVGEGATALTVIVCQYLGALASALVLARFAWWLLPVVLLPALVIAVLGIRTAAEQRETVLRVVDDKRRFMYYGDLSYAVAESKELRVFGLSDWITTRGRQHMWAHRAPIESEELRHIKQRWLSFALAFLALLVVFVAVGVAVAHGRAPVAAETSVLACAWSVFFVVATTWNLVVVIGGLAPLLAYDRLVTLLDAGPPEPVEASAGPDPVPLVRFEQVAFSYEGGTRPVLDGLDLELAPGELLAIVGLNGAGKSTLIKLLAGLYVPSAGRITADGIPIERLGPAAWRRRVAVVFQDFVKYEASARDNVALGQAGPVDRKAVLEAARTCGFDTVVVGLAQGWDTPLTEGQAGGTDLSGGQWQQVALARALYAVQRGARLIVLDEPTAHLDVRTEFEVFRQLRDARTPAGERVSVVLVSHRLSSVRMADRIVLLQEGRITEAGNHEQLMDLDGRYARMFTLQAERFSLGYDDRIDTEDADTAPLKEGTGA